MSHLSVILLEKVEKLGTIGDVVNVKPGFARNYLLPQSKALRATKDNVAYFETQKVAIEKVNADKRSAAEAEAKKLDGFTGTIIRQASEAGQLYGAINARDIAEAVAEKGVTINRGQVNMNQSFKKIGLFEAEVVMHPEVTIKVKLNIARSEDEAKIQLKTGKALIAAADETLDDAAAKATAPKVEEPAVEELLEDSAIKAKEAAEEAEAIAKVEEEEKAAERAVKKAEKEAAAAAAEAEAEAGENSSEEETGTAETGVEETSEEEAK